MKKFLIMLLALASIGFSQTKRVYVDELLARPSTSSTSWDTIPGDVISTGRIKAISEFGYDEIALQDAINWASVNNGTISLDTSIVLSDTVYLKNNIFINGNGNVISFSELQDYKSAFVANSNISDIKFINVVFNAGIDTLYIFNNNYYSMSNIIFDGCIFDSLVVGPVISRSTSNSMSDNITLRNCIFNNDGATNYPNVIINDFNRGWLKNNIFNGVGVKLEGNINGLWVEGNRFNDVDISNILLRPGIGDTILNAHVNYNSFTNCGITAGKGAIVVGEISTSDSTELMRGVEIVGNIIEGHRGNAITIGHNSTMEDVVCVNNIINGYSNTDSVLTQTSAIQLFLNTFTINRNIKIHGNAIKNEGRVGIRVSSGHSVSIIGNTIENFGLNTALTAMSDVTGIYVGAGIENAIISDNIILNGGNSTSNSTGGYSSGIYFYRSNSAAENVGIFNNIIADTNTVKLLKYGVALTPLGTSSQLPKNITISGNDFLRVDSLGIITRSYNGDNDEAGTWLFENNLLPDDNAITPDQVTSLYFYDSDKNNILDSTGYGFSGIILNYLDDVLGASQGIYQKNMSVTAGDSVRIKYDINIPHLTNSSYPLTIKFRTTADEYSVTYTSSGRYTVDTTFEAANTSADSRIYIYKTSSSGKIIYMMDYCYIINKTTTDTMNTNPEFTSDINGWLNVAAPKVSVWNDDDNVFIFLLHKAYDGYRHSFILSGNGDAVIITGGSDLFSSGYSTLKSGTKGDIVKIEAIDSGGWFVHSQFSPTYY